MAHSGAMAHLILWRDFVKGGRGRQAREAFPDALPLCDAIGRTPLRIVRLHSSMVGGSDVASAPKPLTPAPYPADPSSRTLVG